MGTLPEWHAQIEKCKQICQSLLWVKWSEVKWSEKWSEVKSEVKWIEVSERVSEWVSAWALLEFCFYFVVWAFQCRLLAALWSLSPQAHSSSLSELQVNLLLPSHPSEITNNKQCSHLGSLAIKTPPSTLQCPYIELCGGLLRAGGGPLVLDKLRMFFNNKLNTIAT